MTTYNKFKDQSPQETIHRIECILHSSGLFPVVKWIDEEYQGMLSNRVSLYPTTAGSNGKGTDEAYAMASGYAELMERIQAGIVVNSRMDQELRQYKGFTRCPDEESVSVEDIIAQNDIVTQYFFSELHIVSPQQKRNLLLDFALHFDRRSDGKMICVPFADLAARRIVYLPNEMLLYFYSSNGMAAGNTLEEALVQGLSEIFERYVCRAVLQGVVPPEVPREYLEHSQVIKFIQEIEKGGRYRISIRDCSLGRGIPAVGIVIFDQVRGSFGVKFAAHPSFEVSVERTLTEALQGKKMEEFTSYNMVGDRKSCAGPANYPNIMKVGMGFYPVSFLTGRPSYEFQERDKWKGMNNREMLVEMLGIVKSEGYDVLIRDMSHLGFPAYQILVPGMNEMFPVGYQRIRELHTHSKVIESFQHFPELTEEEERRLLTLMEYTQYSVLQNTIGWFSMLPLRGKEFKEKRMHAILALKLSQYTEAMNAFRLLADEETDSAEKLFYDCAANYAYLLAINTPSDEAASVICRCFPDNVSQRVIEVFGDKDKILKKTYRQMMCFDCENCSYSSTACEYPELRKILFKIKDGLSKSQASQRRLLDELNRLIE